MISIHKLEEYLRENPGALFIIFFQILLIICAILLIQGKSTLADDIAVYAYYSLVIGVILQIISFMKISVPLIIKRYVLKLRTIILRQPHAITLREILIIGTAIRLLLMPFFAHPFDVYAWYTYCIKFLKDGLNVRIILDSSIPFWLLTLVPIAYCYNFFSSIIGTRVVSIGELPPQMNPYNGATIVPEPLFNILVKIPMLIVDIGTTLILYKLIIRFFGEEKAKGASFLFYLNPISIWISASWGQYDSIPAFFTILSFYLLLNDSIFSSAFCLLAATLYRPVYALFFIPTLIYLFKKMNKHFLLRYCFAFLLPILIYATISGMEVTKNSILQIFGLIQIRERSEVFSYGLTYWSIMLFSPLGNYTLDIIQSLLFIILLSISSFLVIRAKFDNPLKDLTIATFLFISIVFLSHRYVDEPLFLWLCPFLILMVVMKILSIRLYSLISLLSFIYALKGFPYFLLPIALIREDLIIPLFTFVRAYNDPYAKLIEGLLFSSSDISLLIILGVTFSILLLFIYIVAIRKIMIE
jgi:Gpi18-like mannosyltransferase